jgi:hypothetical protein
MLPVYYINIKYGDFMIRYVSIILLSFLTFMSVYSKEKIEININIKNDLNQSIAFPTSFGISPDATDVLDKELGEILMPPAPFVGFHTAFEFIDSTQYNNDGTKYYDRIWTNKDLKYYPDTNGTYYVKHKLIFRFGNGKKILINWNKNTISNKIDSIFIKDGLNGIAVKADMKQVDKLEWENDGILELFVHVYYNLSTTSVKKDNEEENIYLYPNPASEYININTSDVIKKIEIYDFLGKLCLVDLNSNVLNVSSLIPGVYSVKIITQNQIFYQKLIKQ